jgi:hypothetical protein
VVAIAQECTCPAGRDPAGANVSVGANVGVGVGVGVSKHSQIVHVA